MEYSCHFMDNLDEYLLKATWKLGSPVDLLLGLEFKSVQISISKVSVLEEKMDGILYQNIKQRMDSWLSTNIRKQDGKPGGIRLKYRMATKLVDYAI